mmetsp:Transcript_14343/g.61518  ORF Transcript_14343/g.61518 Transcript_14343/m.61518 type:complete len:220 (-) Transcript_14343:266-925(-)
MARTGATSRRLSSSSRSCPARTTSWMGSARTPVRRTATPPTQTPETTSGDTTTTRITGSRSVARRANTYKPPVDRAIRTEEKPHRVIRNIKLPSRTRSRLPPCRSRRPSAFARWKRNSRVRRRWSAPSAWSACWKNRGWATGGSGCSAVATTRSACSAFAIGGTGVWRGRHRRRRPPRRWNRPDGARSAGNRAISSPRRNTGPRMRRRRRRRLRCTREK